jgi:hypothetical protein
VSVRQAVERLASDVKYDHLVVRVHNPYFACRERNPAAAQEADLLPDLKVRALRVPIDFEDTYLTAIDRKDAVASGTKQRL